MSLKSKILAFLSSEEPKAIQLAEEKLDNGTVLISEDFKEGMPIFIKSEDEDGENVKLPIGEYQMEDGKILNVEVEGEIASIQEAKIEAEEPSEEPMEEAMEEETEAMEEKETMDEIVYDEAHMEAMHKAIADLVARIEALEGPKESMDEEEEYSEEKVEMSAEEAVVEVKEEVAVEVAPEVAPIEVVEVQEEVAPITHSPEASDEKRVRFYFPKN